MSYLSNYLTGHFTHLGFCASHQIIKLALAERANDLHLALALLPLGSLSWLSQSPLHGIEVELRCQELLANARRAANAVHIAVVDGQIRRAVALSQLVAHGLYPGVAMARVIRLVKRVRSSRVEPLGIPIECPLIDVVFEILPQEADLAPHFLSERTILANNFETEFHTTI